jgi:thioredoxin-like negative regulator of GroEL
VWKASLLWSRGDRTGAWRASDEAMARAPEVPQVIGQRLRMAMDSGDRDQAQAMLDRLAQSAPDAARRLAEKFGLRP